MPTLEPDKTRVSTCSDLQTLTYKERKRIHELRPLEATPHDRLGEPVGWPDGRYLLVPTREGSFGGPNIVGIWNVESARYRGALAGCLSPDAPWTQFRLQDTHFYTTCGQDEVLMWRVDDDMQEICDFEKSLTK